MPNFNQMLALRRDQRARWEQGERILVEAFLGQHPALAADPAMTLDLIYSEIVLREEFGTFQEPLGL